MERCLLVCLILLGLITSCSPKPEQLAPLVEQTVQAMPTQTPYSTNTPYPTYTIPPTYTPIYLTKIVTPTFTPTPLFTATETLTPTETPTPSPTPNPLKTDKKSGFYLVGTNIAPGIWLSTGTGDDCYWAITTKTGDIIDNHFGMAGGTMYISPSAFQVRLDAECGIWTFLQEP